MRGSVTATELGATVDVPQGMPRLEAQAALIDKITADALAMDVTPNWATLDTQYIPEWPTGRLIGFVEVYQNNREEAVQSHQEQVIEMLEELTEHAKSQRSPRSLSDIAKRVHSNAQGKGFWDDDNTQPETEEERLYIAAKLALIHSEVSEALEDLRDPERGVRWYELTASGKPEGFRSELADIIIRVLDVAEWLELNIEAAVVEKAEYNESRPAKHGKAF